MMQKKKSVQVVRNAHNYSWSYGIPRRKGGVFKNRTIPGPSLLPKFIKSLRHSTHQRGALHYGERELSFDETPMVHVKMYRPSMRFKMPNIPCINPHVVDFDYDFEGNGDDESQIYYDNDNVARKSFLKDAEEEYDEHVCVEYDQEIINEDTPCDESIDLKAEEFIEKFYQQMKLQRQISYLQYNEMISRGAN